MTMGESSWFDDPALLIEEVRKADRGARASTPIIEGYEDFKELGRGGQGIVFAATQRSTNRRVAIKVLVGGEYATAQQRTRFAREVDLASSLRHPGIVRVYDSGISKEGHPYLVMELAEGASLGEFCAGRAARDVIETIARACDAVQYAHERGVIHRDIKPGNIRVEHDGTVRIMDFGLAKLDGGAQNTEITDSGQFMGSLPWASPEQASGRTHDIGTRSDVYSMGVVLYQMLTGRMPYDVSSGFASSLRNIESAEPTPIRHAIGGVHADLEAIVMTALAKDPGGRYRGIGDMARDLRAYLAGEPIQARQESAWRVLSRRARRYRAIVWIGGSALVLVCAAGAFAVRQAHTAAVQRDAANEASARAKATVTFLTDLLRSASPTSGQGGREVRVVDLVDQAARTVDTTYASDPTIRVDLHSLLGQVYIKLDMLPQAREQLGAALDTRLAQPGIAASDMQVMQLRGYLASAVMQEGKLPEAAGEYETLIADYRKAGVSVSEQLAAAMSDLGVIYRMQGKLDEAATMYAQAEKATPPGMDESDLTMSLICNEGSVAESKGDYDAAERLYRKALDLRLKVSGKYNIDTLITQNNLAHLYISRTRPADARPILIEGLEASTKVCGPEHVTTLTFMNNLGKVEYDLKHYDESLAILTKAVEIYERTRGKYSPEGLYPLSNLGPLYADMGRLDDAARVNAEVVERSRKINGDKHLSTFIALNNYAITLVNLGRAEEGEKILADLVRESSPEGGVLPAGHPTAAVFHMSHARALIKLERYREAEAELRPALELFRSRLGDASALTRRAAANLVKVYEATGRADQCDDLRALAGDTK